MSKINSPSSKLLFIEAENRGYTPVWLIPELAFAFTVNGHEFFCHDTKTNLNSQLGTRMCDNKVLTRTFLEYLHAPNMPYTYSTNISDINRFFDVHETLIAKPIFGKRSTGVFLIDNRPKIADVPLRHYIFEKYISGEEYRYLILQNQLILYQKRERAPKKDYPWNKKMTNLALSQRNLDLEKMSLQFADKLKMGFVAVDWIVNSQGAYVLELNAAPGLYSATHPDVGDSINLPSILLDAIISTNAKIEPI